MTNNQLKNLIRESIDEVLRETPINKSDIKEDSDCAACSESESDEPCPKCGSTKNKPIDEVEFREWLAEVRNHTVVKLILNEYAANKVKSKAKTNKILKDLYNKSK